MDSLTPLYTRLAEQFHDRFPGQLDGPRTVGREAEYPVVTATGEAGDLRRLWQPLAATGSFEIKRESHSDLIVGLQGEAYSYALEVGLGTVEINTRPCADLFEVEAVQIRAVTALVEVATAQGYRVLGLGVQPRSQPSLDLMSPKRRYQVLYEVMGPDWLWYTVTASEQAQIDITQFEWLDMVNLGNLLAPVFIALCGNSPVWGDALSPHCSAREGRMAQIRAGEYRHGMTERAFADPVDFVTTLSQASCLMLPDATGYVRPGISFADYLGQHGADFAAFLFHEHYIWNSARARTTYGTIELRPACQQPWPEHMAAMALSLGVVENYQAIQTFLSELWPDPWPIMRRYHDQAIALGLAGTEPVTGFLAQVLELVAQGLRQRGLGEEIFLAPLLRRLERGQNPAQIARDRFIRDGMAGLIAYADIRSYL